jgi:hypothetical protein
MFLPLPIRRFRPGPAIACLHNQRNQLKQHNNSYPWSKL